MFDTDFAEGTGFLWPWDFSPMRGLSPACSSHPIRWAVRSLLPDLLEQRGAGRFGKGGFFCGGAGGFLVLEAPAIERSHHGFLPLGGVGYTAGPGHGAHGIGLPDVVHERFC